MSDEPKVTPEEETTTPKEEPTPKKGKKGCKKEKVEKSDRKITAGLSLGFTINLMHYESARIEAHAEVTESGKTFAELWSEVETEINNQIQKQVQVIKDQVSEKETLLGYPDGPRFK